MKVAAKSDLSSMQYDVKYNFLAKVLQCSATVQHIYMTHWVDDSRLGNENNILVSKNDSDVLLLIYNFSNTWYIKSNERKGSERPHSFIDLLDDSSVKCVHVL